MVEFPQDYFEDEVRDGFYVNGLMKRCWAAQIEILNDIRIICEKYNIKWYADCGTLLGAVRHGGFVPWDDDLDICMFRDDYMRFIKVAEKELKSIWKGYKLFNFRNGDYWEVISRVVDMHSLSFDEERTEKFHEFPLEVGVDIFPLDFLCIDRNDEEKRMAICNSIFSIADDKRLKCPDKYINDMLLAIENATGHKFNRNKSLQMQLYTLGEKMFSLYDRKQAKYAALMGYWLKDESHKYDLRWYDQTVMLSFENIEVPVPAAYDAVLRTEYGDYMKIVRTGGAHDYPRFEGQIKELEKEMGEDSPFHKKIRIESLRGVKRINSEGNPRKQVKNQVTELGKLLFEAHGEIRKLVSAGLKEEMLGLLEDCQNTAIYMGTFIEENYGEGLLTVGCLEEYCEQLYVMHEQCALLDYELLDKESDERLSIDQGLGIIDECLEKARKSVESDIIVRKEVVFLPYKVSKWSYMEQLWKKYMDNPGVDVYVIPIPFYYKTALGKLGEECYEGGQFPEYISVTDYMSYDFKERQPDIVYIQNPFDGDNFSETVHPYFYAEKLKRYTDELVYIQSFICEEIDEGEERAYKAMSQYAVSPGVVYADKVIVQSEHMKEMYVKKLTDFFGEETYEMWSSKIIGKSCVPNPQNEVTALGKSEYIPYGCNETTIPINCRDILFRKDGTRKKVVLYNTSVCGMYQNGERMLQKIRSAMTTFKENADNVALIWRIDPLIDETIVAMDKELYKSFRKLVKEYEEEGIGILLTDEEVENTECLLAQIDAYYGDADKLVTLCTGRNIPVMIQNVSV